MFSHPSQSIKLNAELRKSLCLRGEYVAGAAARIHQYVAKIKFCAKPGFKQNVLNTPKLEPPEASKHKSATHVSGETVGI